ncbi:hypothetical protein JM654_23655 [Microbacterium oxydans]|nr:hypothetical protein [Microbacterium oxydans]
MNVWLDEQKAGWFSDAGSTTDPAVGLQTGRLRHDQLGTFFARQPRRRRR